MGLVKWRLGLRRVFGFKQALARCVLGSGGKEQEQ